MTSTFAQTRRSKLAQILVTEGSVKAGELAERLGVTTETIRKDLLYLEGKGIAKKNHGGAVATSELLERSLMTKSSEHMEAKMQIAAAALGLIPDRGTVLLDAGTTTYSIAKALAVGQGVTVISNSSEITQLLSGTDNIVYALGGAVRGTSRAMTGMWTLAALKTVRADIAFIGTDGFAMREGPCSASYAEADVKKMIVQSSAKAVVVCDSSKFCREALVQYCDWADIDLVITDSDVPPRELERLRERTKVMLAPR